jgi:hypothetical protein
MNEAIECGGCRARGQHGKQGDPVAVFCFTPGSAIGALAVLPQDRKATIPISPKQRAWIHCRSPPSGRLRPLAQKGRQRRSASAGRIMLGANLPQGPSSKLRKTPFSVQINVSRQENISAIYEELPPFAPRRGTGVEGEADGALDLVAQLGAPICGRYGRQIRGLFAKHRVSPLVRATIGKSTTTQTHPASPLPPSYEGSSVLGSWSKIPAPRYDLARKRRDNRRRIARPPGRMTACGTGARVNPGEQPGGRLALSGAAGATALIVVLVARTSQLCSNVPVRRPRAIAFPRMATNSSLKVGSLARANGRLNATSWKTYRWEPWARRALGPA